jgi:hypothetical protein
MSEKVNRLSHGLPLSFPGPPRCSRGGLLSQCVRTSTHGLVSCVCSRYTPARIGSWVLLYGLRPVETSVQHRRPRIPFHGSIEITESLARVTVRPKKTEIETPFAYFNRPVIRKRSNKGKGGNEMAMGERNRGRRWTCTAGHALRELCPLIFSDIIGTACHRSPFSQRRQIGRNHWGNPAGRLSEENGTILRGGLFQPPSRVLSPPPSGNIRKMANASELVPTIWSHEIHDLVFRSPKRSHWWVRRQLGRKSESRWIDAR